MSTPIQTLALLLPRVAWAGHPYDSLSELLVRLAQAHLLTTSGRALDDTVDVARGPSALFPELLRMMRSSGKQELAFGATESLVLLTAAPGDVASLPAVSGLSEQVMSVGSALMVRDPDCGSAVVLHVSPAGPEVSRWHAHSVDNSPVPPQPSGLAEASANLTEALTQATVLIEQIPGQLIDAGGIELDSYDSVFPEGIPSRVAYLLHRADRVDTIIKFAIAHPELGRVAGEREPILRSLRLAVDAARRAAVGVAAAEALKEHQSTPWLDTAEWPRRPSRT